MYIQTDDSYRSLAKREDSNGKKFVKAISKSGVAANVLAMISAQEDGYLAETIADDNQGTIGLASTGYYVGAAEDGSVVASGSLAWFQIEGPVDDVQGVAAGFSGTKGHAVEWSIGEVFSRGSVYVGAAYQFAVLTETLSGSTTANIYLTGKLSAGTS